MTTTVIETDPAVEVVMEFVYIRAERAALNHDKYWEQLVISAPHPNIVDYGYVAYLPPSTWVKVTDFMVGPDYIRETAGDYADMVTVGIHLSTCDEAFDLQRALLVLDQEISD